MAGIYTVKQRSAIKCKIEGNNLAKFDILPEGPLSHYSAHVYGITTFNFATKVFTLTFNADLNKDNMSEFLTSFSEGKKLNITLFARRPLLLQKQ